jgi:hypothetical protein
MAGTTARYKPSTNALLSFSRILTCRNNGLKAMSSVGQAQWMDDVDVELLMLNLEIRNRPCARRKLSPYFPSRLMTSSRFSDRPHSCNQHAQADRAHKAVAMDLPTMSSTVATPAPI